ncbi:SDR family NAD(P)-dependent oxidoreductase [Demequina sediminicola]|uniref:SDR family NAD(P)-dependent oxidoreductase n=1 Tax=Demequina sediminicola TaxID=1095026 RepID=UPI000782DE5D|nr:SDR family NAD(P)-dependent oxidoreductase [Demequina sediminicola]
MDLNNRHGIVTGAGQGIGRALAVELAGQGGHLLLVGRTEETLTETAKRVEAAGGTAEILVQDLGRPEAIDAVLAAVEPWDTVDTLVNNAGNVRAGRLEETTAADVQSMIDLNLVAPLQLTRALLPKLRASTGESGSLILNISSEIALVAMPFYAVYAATKSGVAAFGEAMRRELSGTGVHVATVYPGATDTDMMASQNADWERRPVSAVVADVLAGLAADEHEITATAPEAHDTHRLNATDPLKVDAAIVPGLDDLEAAVKDHRSI